MITAWKPSLLAGTAFLSFTMVAVAKAPRRFSSSAVDQLAENITRTSKVVSAKDISDRAELMDRSGLYILAQHERMRLLRAGRINAHDFERLGNTALSFDHVDELSGIAAKGGTLPTSVRLALAGRELRSGQLGRAASYVPADVSFLNSLAEGATKMRGALVASGVYGAQNKMAQALDALSAVPAGTSKAGRVDLGPAQLQRARINYGEGRLNEAMENLVQLPRSSGSWYPGVMVGAWAAYRLKDYNLALGSLMTLHSPFLAAKFGPESHILEAATLYRLCYFESAAASIAALRKKYDKIIPSIEQFRRQYANRFSLVSAIVNYARGSGAEGGSYPENHFDLIADGLLSQEPIAEVDRTLVQIKDESRILQDVFAKADDNRFSRGLKNQYTQILEIARREAYRKGAKTATKHLATMRSAVSEALEAALAVEVEINTRVRERLITGQTARMKDINFEAEIKKGYEFWPFEGEFWRDEVGGYAFATSDVCGEQGT